MRSVHVIVPLLLLASCELVTQIEIPEEPRKAVINSVFRPDSTWWISVTTTTPINVNFHTRVFDPRVTLTDENGQQVPLSLNDSVFFDPNIQGLFGGVRYTSTSRPIAGMTYRIDVSGANVLDASATAQTPTLVELLDVKLDSANAIAGNEEYSLAIPIKFTFDDPAGQGDYYYPVLTVQTKHTYTNPITGEVIVFESERGFFLSKTPPTSDFFSSDRRIGGISDESFDGQRHTATGYVLIWNQFSDNDEVGAVRFYLTHAREEYHRYFQSVELYNQTRDNPFAEPVQVYTNVQGGLGIFAGSTTSVWEFK